MDAAMDIRNGRVDYCAVIRDSNGHVMAVGFDHHVFSDDADIAKIEALHFGIWLANEISLSTFVVEADLLQTTQFVSGICHTHTKLYYIILEIQILFLAR